MRCCLLSCVNNSTAPPDITFYQIPKEYHLKQLWVEAIGIPEWELRPNSAVCSAHFREFDLSISETGEKLLIDGAVPSLSLNTVEDLQAQADFKTCRVCLAMDRKMFNIRDHNLHHLYKMIVGVTVEARDYLPQMLCWECTSKLLSLKKFKEQAQTSQLLLSDKLAVNNILTIGDIKSIDRIHNKLKSNLTIKHNVPNEFDLNIDVFDLTMNHMEMLLDIKPECDQGPTLELSGMSPKSEIPKCSKVEPESTILVEMLDLKQNIDVKDITDHNISDEHDSNMSPHPQHSDSEIETKPVRKLVKKEVTAAKRKRPIKEVNVKKKRKHSKGPRIELPGFEVRKLTLEEQQAAVAARARSAAYLDAPYKCEVCYKGFLSERTLATHAVRHTEKCGKYRCAVCKYRYRLERHVRTHVVTHHTNQYTCKVCGLVTQSSSTAKNHQDWHDGSTYQCPHCPTTLTKYTSYMSHLRIKHSSRFSCELCGYTFVSERGVQTHKNKSHVLDAQEVLGGPYCEECKLRFASDEAYQRHLTQSSVHSSDDDPVVSSRTTTERTGNTSARCTPASSAPSSGATACASSAAGGFRALLLDHMLSHSGEKRFKCQTCDKAFTHKNNLAVHQRVHGAKVPIYRCPYCDRQFHFYPNRDRHVKTVHKGVKQFQCEICGKEFTSAAGQRAHVDHVHHKKPRPKRVRARAPTAPPTAYRD
ncbi:zinc finger protein 120-like isoform X3 [Aricia agestis]|uniref:zinc finger protein 120-like isoform X3 n=1 Tax=Aricia agestis TaxID=91739 RepID=UPI001C20B056|nr:zinc finger protein 120-like isoform X3 [Aricia agestis]